VSFAGNTSVHGNLNSGKNFIVYTSTDSGTNSKSYTMGVMIKQTGTTWASSDLTGTWHVNGLVSGDTGAGQTPGWFYYDEAVDSNGNSTPGALTDSKGIAFTPTGKVYSISSDGAVTISGNPFGFHGQMSADKNLIVAVAGPMSAGSGTAPRVTTFS